MASKEADDAVGTNVALLSAVIGFIILVVGHVIGMQLQHVLVVLGVVVLLATGVTTTASIAIWRQEQRNKLTREYVRHYEEEVAPEKTIIVTDDDQGIREAMGEYLRVNGFRVFEEYDAQGTLDCLSSNTIDLVITDLSKPDMDGIDLCRKIKAEYDIPVIMTTGVKYSEEEAEAAGVDLVIWVPIKFDELLVDIEDLLANYPT
jgi:CheY-like chemotaxis protein